MIIEGFGLYLASVRRRNLGFVPIEQRYFESAIDAFSTLSLMVVGKSLIFLGSSKYRSYFTA